MGTFARIGARLIVVALFASSGEAGADCPSWIRDPSVPECPASDNTILPDTFPAMAHVVSDSSSYVSGTGAEQEFTADFVEEILKGAGDRVPMILMPVSEKTFEHVKARVAATADSPERKAAYEKALVRVPGAMRYTWQQDYFESFISPETGMPVLREVSGYGRAGNSLDHVASEGSLACSSLSKGKKLPPEGTPGYSFENGMMGGNIEALPGGLCLHGDNQPWESFARHYCGDRKNEVVIDSSWLTVGHVDEIVSVVPKPGTASPCDFALTVASPAKALELLKQRPNDRFGDFHTSAARISRDALTLERSASSGMRTVCDAVRDYRNRKVPGATEPTPGPADPRGAGKAAWLLEKLRGLWLREARAGVTRVSSAPKALSAEECSKVTNGEVALALEHSEQLRNLNALIQADLEKSKAKIRARISERLPQCEVQMIDVPDLFWTNGWLVEKPGGGYELPKGSVNSIHPNPTNQVISGKSVIYPHPQNAAFKEYMDKSYRELGLTPASIDSHDYAHVGMGNIHCATHSIRFCRPREEVPTP